LGNTNSNALLNLFYSFTLLFGFCFCPVGFIH
jgi:hypothetical protein